MAKILLALGGNALGNTPSEQREAVKTAAQGIVELVLQGNQVVVCHGNGPQVGAINTAFAVSFKNGTFKEMMPFYASGAMSQGYIGFYLQNAIENALAQRRVTRKVVTILTQTVVDVNDPAFLHPTKPVGRFMTHPEALQMQKDYGYEIVEDAGRGWRRVVASPLPLDLVEKVTIQELVESDTIVICGGGGGVPVFVKDNLLYGVDAVIDKDFTSAKLAELINVDRFVILTAVDNVMLNWGKPNQQVVRDITVVALQRELENRQFASGSMLPKVGAVMRFVQATGKPAHIANLNAPLDAVIAGQKGTKITLN